MRILIIPLLGMSQSERDSNFIVWTDYAKYISEYRKTYFYIVLPERRKDYFKLPSYIKPIFTDWKDNFFIEFCFLDSKVIELFSWAFGNYMIDAIFTSKACIVPYLDVLMNDYRKKYKIPIYVIEPLVRYHTVDNDMISGLTGLGYCLSKTWFLNEVEYDLGLRYVQRYTSIKMYDEFVKRAFVRGLGVKTDEIEEIIKNTKKNEKFTIIFAARLSRDKRPDKLVKIFEKFFSSGRDVNIIVNTHQATSKRISLLSEASSIKKIETGVDRFSFYRNVAKSHLFVCTSDVEGFPTGFWEQLYILKVGIFPAKRWVLTSLPKKYPYIYKNYTEAHALLKWIYENYDEAVKKVSWIQEWIRNNVSMRHIAKKFADEVLEDVNSIPITLSDNFKDVVLHSVKNLGKKFTYLELKEELKKNSHMFNPNKTARLGVPNMYEIHRFLLSNGYRDLLNKEFPVYSKI